VYYMHHRGQFWPYMLTTGFSKQNKIRSEAR
jgi:hypothetical protein